MQNTSHAVMAQRTEPKDIRRIRTRLPTCLSIGLGIFFATVTLPVSPAHAAPERTIGAGKSTRQRLAILIAVQSSYVEAGVKMGRRRPSCVHATSSTSSLPTKSSKMIAPSRGISFRCYRPQFHIGPIGVCV